CRGARQRLGEGCVSSARALQPPHQRCGGGPARGSGGPPPPPSPRRARGTPPAPGPRCGHVACGAPPPRPPLPSPRGAPAPRALSSDRTVGPVRVALRRPEPPSTEAYRKFFRATVTFAAARNVLELSRELVEAPLPSGHAELARHSDEVMSRALLQIDPQNLA